MRFADGVAELLKDPRSVLLEVGPGQTLSTLARQHPDKSAEKTILSSLPLTGAQEQRGILESLGRLWMSGRRGGLERILRERDSAARCAANISIRAHALLAGISGGGIRINVRRRFGHFRCHQRLF